MMRHPRARDAAHVPAGLAWTGPHLPGDAGADAWADAWAGAHGAFTVRPDTPCLPGVARPGTIGGVTC